MSKFFPLWVSPNPETGQPYLVGDIRKDGSVFRRYAYGRSGTEKWLDADEFPENPQTSSPYRFGDKNEQGLQFQGFASRKSLLLPMFVKANDQKGRPFLTGDQSENGEVFRDYAVNVDQQGVVSYIENWSPQNDVSFNEQFARPHRFGDTNPEGLVFLKFVRDQEAQQQSTITQDPPTAKNRLQKNPVSKGWPPDVVHRLIVLWTNGYSASAIGRLLGGRTRNAIIGKAHRMGLPNRATQATPESQDRLNELLARVKSKLENQADALSTEFSQTTAAYRQRPGQQQFRQEVLSLFQGRCAVTGTETSAVLEAAHIIPFSVSEDNDLSNGICLRADIHSLFDLGLISISENWLVCISDKLTDPEYSELDGKKVDIPSKAKDALKTHNLRWHRTNVFV